MKEFGTFEKGIFKRVGQLAPGEKRNQDAYEAIWEHVNKRKLVYPKPRYGEAILMKPENFEWEASEDEPGFARKQLCIFSERSLQFSMLKLEPARAGVQLSRGGIQIGFVVNGSGAVNGQALRKYSAFSGREDFELTSDEGMEVLLVGLPIFARSQAGNPGRGRIRSAACCVRIAAAALLLALAATPGRGAGAVLSGQADQGAGRLSARRRQRPLRPRDRRRARAPCRGQAHASWCRTSRAPAASSP